MREGDTELLQEHHSRYSELAHLAELCKLQVRVRVRICHRCPNNKHQGPALPVSGVVTNPVMQGDGA